MLERTTQQFLWKLIMQQTVALLNEHSCRKENCVTATKSDECVVVLGEKSVNQVQRHYCVEYGRQSIRQRLYSLKRLALSSIRRGQTSIQ
jgi:hypothetical protein